jgi:hypothetical protein
MEYQILLGDNADFQEDIFIVHLDYQDSLSTLKTMR